MKVISLWSWMALVALLLAGCGEGPDNLPATVDAEGTVTLDGKAIEGASIVFVPDGGQYPAFAMSGSNGEFSLKAFEAKSGAVPGSYKVQVSRTIEIQGEAPNAADLGEDAAHASEEELAGVNWINDLPAKYANPNTSEIVLQVPDGGTQDLKIELVSK